jgi:alpha-tubulin suppressor-like RCC1 family protein
MSMVALRIAGLHGVRRAVPAVVAMGLALAAAGPALAVSGTATGGTATGGTAARHVAARSVVAVLPDEADHWGYFFGDSSTADDDVNFSPVAIDLPAPVKQIGTSNSTQYALLTNGQVWAWGQGTAGELGDGGSVNSFTTPVQVEFPPGVQIAFLATDAMPYDTGLAVDTNGNAWGWGMNKGGALCTGNTKHYNKPVELPFTNVTALAGADGHAVYDAGGTVSSCGKNTFGVLGDGTAKASTVPVPVSGLAGQNVTELVSSWQNAGALLSDGQYYDWGFNTHGELGNGTVNKSSYVPVLVNIPDSSPVTQVAQGGSTSGNGQTIVMLADGSLYAWGDDASAQLGDGGTGLQASPEQIFSPAGVTYQTLASGGATSYAITTSGQVYAWGNSSKGEVGDGKGATAKTPVMVDSGATYISSTAGNVAVG